MTRNNLPRHLHPAGAQLPVEMARPDGPVTLDTFAGSVEVEWQETSLLTPLGQIVFSLST
jgi:hypothetical protein